jgi:hypothetical protein
VSRCARGGALLRVSIQCCGYLLAALQRRLHARAFDFLAVRVEDDEFRDLSGRITLELKWYGRRSGSRKRQRVAYWVCPADRARVDRFSVKWRCCDSSATLDG